jgi:hypothetical protein
MKLSAFGVVVAGWLAACSSGDEGSSSSDDGASQSSSSAPASGSGAREPVELDVRFVETPGGMTVEAISEREVQTFSCATRSCAGLCDECAAGACRDSGGLAGACRDLVAQCKNTCTCAGGGSDTGRDCGLPVCGTSLGGINVCMIGNEPADATRTPVPDVTPLDPAARPAGSSTPSSSSRPAF